MKKIIGLFYQAVCISGTQGVRGFPKLYAIITLRYSEEAACPCSCSSEFLPLVLGTHAVAKLMCAWLVSYKNPIAGQRLPEYFGCNQSKSADAVFILYS